MYHYVRDAAKTAYTDLKAMSPSAFEDQVDGLTEEADPADLADALAFLRGDHRPPRDLFLLTFDDGFREHLETVTPILAQRGIQGLFFVPTAPIEEHIVLPVHMSHFLMARLGLSAYRAELLDYLAGRGIHWSDDDESARRAAAAYVLDAPETARFKYFVNFILPEDVRDEALAALFERHISDQESFASDLYLSWDDARKMQRAGMVIGGHSHRHRPLTGPSQSQVDDLTRCRDLMARRLAPQRSWPFSYPYGKRSSFTAETISILRSLGFCCAFTTETGVNAPTADLFQLDRVDCADVRIVLDRSIAKEVSH
jgi:peptidoglycan/xylan/chitin deacetylase (PgdA/CDA1 family)